MDIFSAPMTIEKKAEWLKGNLDKIAEKSGDYLLLPIGADHLGVETDITEQINKVNSLLEHYEIKLSNPFEYFELVKIDPHRANQLQVFRESQLCGDDRKPGPRKISINIVMLCELLCDRAEKYYSVNKEKFGFINFNLVNIDYQTAAIFGIKNRNVYGDSEKTT